jgi:hypothetical protein
VKPKIPASVPPAEHAHFTTLVLAEFATLHEGNAVRFGIRPLEYSEWLGR